MKSENENQEEKKSSSFLREILVGAILITVVMGVLLLKEKWYKDKLKANAQFAVGEVTKDSKGYVYYRFYIKARNEKLYPHTGRSFYIGFWNTITFNRRPKTTHKHYLVVYNKNDLEHSEMLVDYPLDDFPLGADLEENYSIDTLDW